jgi:uncharacterized protein involved in oxidation of intracellular sulfur
MANDAPSVAAAAPGRGSGPRAVLVNARARSSGRMAGSRGTRSADARCMKVLLILNDGPYGTERSYNGLRLALALAKTADTVVRVFLMADAIACAKPGQTTPEGYYNVGRMLKGLIVKGVEIGTCGSCMDARGYTDADLAEGIRRSSMAQLAAWTIEADRIITF